MAGFFALRRSLFLSTQRLDPIGYKIGLELMVKAGCKRVREVPIAFENRLHGSSKLTLRQQWDYLRHLKRLYEFKLGALARPAQFALVGASGMAVDLACFAALLWVARLGVARALAVWAAMTWNFWLNRRLTFSDARAQPVLPQYLLFCLSCALGAVVNWAVSVGLATRLAWFGRWPLVAAACGVVAGAALNYGFSTLVAFRRRPPPSAG
jgi:dolichol-phosphate mannosyltransferase